jgi:hypothetical protein
MAGDEYDEDLKTTRLGKLISCFPDKNNKKPDWVNNIELFVSYLPDGRFNYLHLFLHDEHTLQLSGKRIPIVKFAQLYGKKQKAECGTQHNLARYFKQNPELLGLSEKESNDIKNQDLRLFPKNAEVDVDSNIVTRHINKARLTQNIEKNENNDYVVKPDSVVEKFNGEKDFALVNWEKATERLVYRKNGKNNNFYTKDECKNWFRFAVTFRKALNWLVEKYPAKKNVDDANANAGGPPSDIDDKNENDKDGKSSDSSKKRKFSSDEYGPGA